MTSCSDIEALLRELGLPPELTFAVQRVCALEDPRAVFEEAERVLVGSEVTLFARARSPKRKAEFCAGRIAARAALACRGLDPELACHEIKRDARGAPLAVRWPLPVLGGAVVGRSSHRRSRSSGPRWETLYPSISHSHGFAAAVVAPWRVGVDLERIEERPESLWRRFFCAAEQSLLLAQPESERCRFVNVLWTRKEAACKVGGWGGTVPFRAIDCSATTTEIEGRRIVLRSASRPDFAVSVACEVGRANFGKGSPGIGTVLGDLAASSEMVHG